jgi:tetratricopeptide (TPR) repeat protein
MMKLFFYLIPLTIITLTTGIITSREIFALTPREISAKGKSFTVMIEGTEEGSGVIIENNNNVYTVITNWHVVDTPGEYIIVTPDRKRYQVPYNQINRLPDYDLAILTFTANINSATATIGKSSNLVEGDNVYIGGFPMAIAGVPERGYSFIPSSINQLLTKGEDGYTFTHNNFGTPGTSGGALLDDNGDLVGINGEAVTEGNTGKTFGRGIPIETFLTKRNAFILPEGVKPPEDFISVGDRKAKAKDYQGAISAYNQALQENPKDVNVYYKRGKIYYQLKSYRSAIKDFEQVIKFNPQNADVYVYRGLTYYNLKEYQKALLDYDRALKINPDYAIAYNNRGLTYNNLKEYKKALLDYDRALKINPDYAEAYNNRGLTYNDLKEYQKALLNYDRAIKINPDYALVYNNRGVTYNNLKEYQKALLDYDRALKINPDYAEAYYNRGLTYYNLKEYQKALLDYDRALKINPDFALAYNNIGLLKYEEGKIYEAMKQFEKAISIDQKFAEPQMALAVIFYQQGNKEKAIKLAESALKIDDQFAKIEYLKYNSWGDQIIADTQKLLTEPRLQVYVKKL